MSDASSHGHVSKNAKGAANAAPGRRPALGDLTNQQPAVHATHVAKNAQQAHLPVKKQAAAQKHALAEQVVEEQENQDSRQQVRTTHTHNDRRTQTIRFCEIHCDE